ncbi:MAG: A/G-specific adenine glycosylase [Ignisphaera sp.]|nr:A/G-specific adenine glycosylase [Ignisphaera sp.]MDW8085827.1 A/G-specific adenine glycosylase [Ignisphaera sp.]
MIDLGVAELFRRRVAEWYSTHGAHSLPWRSTSNPWHILVAGVLLRNTRVEQVAKVYQRFLERFPDPRTLASASVDEIRGVIRSLGMQNRRATELKKLAEIIAERFRGSVPCNQKLLVELPGVGDYIASEVLLAGCGQPKPIVDRNVVRLLSRVFMGVDPPGPSARDVWRIAESLTPRRSEDARVFSYGVLDLARAVCRVRKPLCVRCPVNTVCSYYSRVRHIV